MKIGLITYDYFHLKTEQLVCKYVENKDIDEIDLFAMQFHQREKRNVLFSHRPEMSKGISTKDLAEFDKVNFFNFDGKERIGKDCDIFVIGGAGILNIEFANGKPIVNSHPGIVPLTRGLDSFKWAILNGDPLGVTIHLIDHEVDKGEILFIKKTPVFKSDTLETLARRHYEIEIQLLGNVTNIIKEKRQYDYPEKPAKRRMSYEVELEMVQEFSKWKKKFTD